MFGIGSINGALQANLLAEYERVTKAHAQSAAQQTLARANAEQSGKLSAGSNEKSQNVAATYSADVSDAVGQAARAALEVTPAASSTPK